MNIYCSFALCEKSEFSVVGADLFEAETLDKISKKIKEAGWSLDNVYLESRMYHGISGPVLKMRRWEGRCLEKLLIKNHESETQIPH